MLIKNGLLPVPSRSCATDDSAGMVGLPAAPIYLPDVPFDLTHVVERGPALQQLAMQPLTALVYNCYPQFNLPDGILFQDSGGKSPEETITSGTGRTVARRGTCAIAAEFSYVLTPPRSAKVTQTVAQLRPQLFIDSNVKLAGYISNISVNPFPGTITLIWYRGVDGRAEAVRLTTHSENLEALQAWGKQNPPIFAPPATFECSQQKCDRNLSHGGALETRWCQSTL